MRKLIAAALILPYVAYYYASRLAQLLKPHLGLSGTLPRNAGLQVSALIGSILLVVCLLLVGLPVEHAEGLAPPSLAPLVPQADAHADAGMALNGPFQVQFNKPMNEGSVEAALTVSPEIALRYRWDATDQVLSVLPATYWEPVTTYQIDISVAARDQEGLGLSAPIHDSFQTGLPTGGEIAATIEVDGQISPITAFQITFTRPVKLATVMLHMKLDPPVDLTIQGDDPTDQGSTVFTATPEAQLEPKTTYTASFTDGGADAAGAPLLPVTPFSATTMGAPTVVRFRPQDGTYTYDTHQVVSVRFTEPMDRKSTQAAFVVTVAGKAVAGTFSWTENDTVLALTPRYAFKVGQTVVAKVTTAARSKGGLQLAATSTATFSVKQPQQKSIGFNPGGASTSAPYYGSEVYYLSLMNCTRTGGWVTPNGACSTDTNHTLPAQGAIALDANISNKVARPYAKYMADRRILDHYAYHDPQWRICNWGGYCGWAWGENIASPSSAGQSGMIAIELFYQNESPCRCEHYYNIMAPFLHRAGIGVWVSNGVVRVAIDFTG